jgi:glycosyltransferase involved in cell wall biosynthesis
VASLHILIVSTINSRRGGTQHIAARIAEDMLRRGHCVTIAHDRDDPGFVFSLPVGVNLFPYNRSQEQASIHRVRSELQRIDPDVCLCMQSSREFLFWAVTLLGSGIPFIYSERTSPYIMASPPRWNNAGRTAAMSGADAIQLLLPEYAETVPACFQDRVRIIGNPIPTGIPRRAAPITPHESRYRLIYLGRLIKTKNPLLLAEAFRQLANVVPEWDVHFWGSGEEMPALKNFLNKHSILQNRLFMHGDTDTPLAILSTGHLFCSPSQYEGFPNAVLEALTCGLPVVGFAGCTGINSLVRSGVNGFLAQKMTAESLADALLRLMSAPALRETMGKNALAVHEQYAADTIFDQWERLFRDMADRKNATVMDSFQEEPFAGQARLSAVARREWLFRDFGMPMPYSVAWWKQRFAIRLHTIFLHAMRSGERMAARVAGMLSLTAHLRRTGALFFSGNFTYARYLFRQLSKTVRMLPLQHSERTKNFIEDICGRISVENKLICCIGCRDEQELSIWEKKNIASVTGVDLVSVSPHIHIMDMHNMSFNDDSFDIIYACHALEHSLHPQKATNEFVRIVKNNGYIAMEIPTNFIRNDVDLHSFNSIEVIRDFFSTHILSIVSEEFISLFSEKNVIKEDIFRIIYQIKK